MVKTSVVGVIERRFTVKQNTIEGILNYDKDNAYPQRIAATIAASGTGSACAKRYGKHIAGRGFFDEAFAAIKVNRKKLTTNELLKKTAWDYARFNGFAWHVNYNVQGQVAEVQHIPFEHCRFCIPDDAGYIARIAVYDDWARERSKKIDKRDIDKILVFNPDPEVVKKQIENAGGIEKYQGQVFYFTEVGLEYPVAPCDPVLEDMETDSQISVFNWRTVKTGFIQQTSYTQIGRFKNEEDREEFKTNLKNFQGADNSNQIVLTEVDSKDEAPIIESFPVTINDKLFDAMGKSVTEKVIRNYGIPLTLVSVAQPGQLGLSKEFEEAESTYDNSTVDERMLISEQFKKVFTFWKEQVIPQSLLIIPKSGVKTDSTKQPLATALGVGGIQALQTILVDGTLEKQQKINSLIFIFGVPKLEAEALVNGTVIES